MSLSLPILNEIRSVILQSYGIKVELNDKTEKPLKKNLPEHTEHGTVAATIQFCTN